jgi:hypothetical protein
VEWSKPWIHARGKQSKNEKVGGEVNEKSNDNLPAPKRVIMLELCLLNVRFFNSFRDWMRCYHDLLKTRTSFLFMLEG